MKNSLKSLWDCIIHEENASCWSERVREGKVSHHTASVMLNTDAEHICQITGLKIDTFTTDCQLHTLQRRTTKQTRFKQTNDMECCTTASLRGCSWNLPPNSRQFLQKLQKPVLSFSAMTDADGCILPGLGVGWGVRFKIKERDILVFKTRRLKEAASAPVSFPNMHLLPHHASIVSLMLLPCLIFRRVLQACL